ncbi:hypothetical protein NJ7G_1903 [Natrinema sp. J7-2]|nr:hypothetical protein NJ7G_1903 [Natrinema sp. J7-2]
MGCSSHVDRRRATTVVAADESRELYYDCPSITERWLHS